MNQIEEIKAALKASDSILIGAGSGLSTSVGFDYVGPRFHQHFGDFIARYHFRSLYEASFHPYQDEEEFWAFWSRVAYYERYSEIPKPQVMKDLLALVEGKDYFIITTNVDHVFQRCGFDKQRLFYTQGDYGLWQCAEPCCQETIENREQVMQMFASQQERRIPTEMIPYCPHCGGPLTTNLRADSRFVQDAGWYQALERYQQWLDAHKDGRIVFLDLGSGSNTPAIFKYPFMRMTYENPQATYITVNLGEAYTLKEIAERSICVNRDIGAVLQELR